MALKSDLGRLRVELLREAAVVSAATAAELLPCSRQLARHFLETHHLIHECGGSEVVIWGDVLIALRGGSARSSPLEHHPRRSFDLLDPM